MTLTVLWLVLGCNGTKGGDTDTDVVADPDTDTTDTDTDVDTDLPPPEVPVVLPPDLPLPPIEPFETFVRSGSRLEAVAFQTTEGILVDSTGFHDTLLDLDCTFVQTSASAWHCLPLSGLIRTASFPEPTCSGAPLLRTTDPQCTPQAWESAGFAVEPTCGLAYHRVFETGSQVSIDAASEAWALVDDVCVPDGPWANAPAYETVGEVPLSTFVAAESVIVEVEPGAFVTQIHGEDGSVRMGALVTRNGESCSLLETDVGWRCVPQVGARHRPRAGYFADGSCSVPLAGTSFVADCRTPWIGARERDDGTHALFTLGPQIPVSQAVFREVDGVCLSTAPPADETLFWLSQPVDASQFPELARDSIGTTLTQEWASTPSGARVHSLGSLEMDGFSCVIATLAGESDAVCVPIDRAVELADLDRYSDAACTEPLFEANGQLLADVVYPTCTGELPTVGELLEAGAAHTGPVYRYVSGTCQVDPTPPSTFSRVPADLPVLPRVPPQAP
ncbi:MAG: hypothetical protein R3F61_01685 [Myxococcota bacterium]